MLTLRRAILALVINLAVLYNIERLDFGQTNVIDIQSVVYVLALVMVLCVIAIPYFYRSRLIISLGWAFVVFGAAKIFTENLRPVFGGIYTYLTITEMVLLWTAVVFAYQVARSLRDFEGVVENITFADASRRIKPITEAAEGIQTELIRARRHHLTLSVIVVEPEPSSIRAALHRTVREVLQNMMARYVFVSLAGAISKNLRRTDVVLTQDTHGRYIILSPETDRVGSMSLIQRIESVAAEMGVAVSCGVAAFPSDALTFDELVKQAQRHIIEPTPDSSLTKAAVPTENLPEQVNEKTPNQT